MTAYAIGDVQGCHGALVKLLSKIGPASDDEIWFVGDLVNRGGASLATLREVKALQQRTKITLGNHDLSLLAYRFGPPGRKHNEEFDEIIAAEDGEDILEWLARQRLCHVDPELGFALVHAGIDPRWDVPTALREAACVEKLLQDARSRTELFATMYGDTPRRWSADLQGADRWRAVINVFTRMRFCTPDGTLDLRSKGPPGTQPKGFFTWFSANGRIAWPQRIVFGHWSTLGLLRDEDVVAIDTGYVWGGELTAVRLDETLQVLQVSAD